MALARISGVHKYTFGVNWVSNSFSSHCINKYTKIWILVCPQDTHTPVWLKPKTFRKRSIYILCLLYICAMCIVNLVHHVHALFVTDTCIKCMFYVVLTRYMYIITCMYKYNNMHNTIAA